MSFKRTILWRCDDCLIEQVKEGFGVPSGWAWYQQKGQPVKHVCPTCPIPEGIDPKAQERVP